MTMIDSCLKLLANKFFPSRVRIISDMWALEDEAHYLSKTLSLLHISHELGEFRDRREIYFFLSRYVAMECIQKSVTSGLRICFPYYHGYPYHGNETFDTLFLTCISTQERISRIRISHERMRQYLLDGGFPPEKMQKIFIPVDTDVFSPQKPETRRRLREKMGVPQNAFVIGSFQKDGNGWEGGFVPKLVKGPDLLLTTLALVKQRLSEVFVVLSGPARGYVKRGLEHLGIPYLHVYYEHPSEVAGLFPLLDAYCISSRQEGGPKGLLEAMASGVPVVSTPVGQVPEIAADGVDALISSLPVDTLPMGKSKILPTCEELAHKLCQLAENSAIRQRLVKNGVMTARRHDYRAQAGQWQEFFDHVCP